MDERVRRFVGRLLDGEGMSEACRAVGVVGVVGQHHGVRTEIIEPCVGDLAAVRNPSVDFG